MISGWFLDMFIPLKSLTLTTDKFKILPRPHSIKKMLKLFREQSG